MLEHFPTTAFIAKPNSGIVIPQNFFHTLKETVETDCLGKVYLHTKHRTLFTKEAKTAPLAIGSHMFASNVIPANSTLVVLQRC